MVLVPTQNAFWLVGLGIGLIFGGVPTAERPLLLSLVPEAEAGRFFSLHAALLARRGGRWARSSGQRPSMGWSHASGRASPIALPS